MKLSTQQCSFSKRCIYGMELRIFSVVRVCSDTKKEVLSLLSLVALSIFCSVMNHCKVGNNGLELFRIDIRKILELQGLQQCTLMHFVSFHSEHEQTQKLIRFLKNSIAYKKCSNSVFQERFGEKLKRWLYFWAFRHYFMKIA